MPSMGGSATLISAPRYGDLTNVDTTGQADHQVFAWDATAAKYKPLTGVVGDGAGGIVPAGAVNAGDQSGVTETAHTLYGSLDVEAGQGAIDNADNGQLIRYAGTLSQDNGGRTLYLLRSLDRLAFHQLGALLLLYNGDQSAVSNFAPADEVVIAQTRGNGAAAFTTNDIGGIGLFGATPPTARPAITGALSTVADAPAKAVLTSIIAALVGCGLASSGTT